MYRETLMDQWRNLYSDFNGEYEFLQTQGDAVAAFNRWYEARVHRWNSITYSEGILLEQENNASFSGSLQFVLKNFRFSVVEPVNEKPFWISIAAGTVAGVIVGDALILLHWGKIRSIISGIVMFVVIVALFLKKNADFREHEKKRVKEKYIQQLIDYQNELAAVCDKYHVQ